MSAPFYIITMWIFKYLVMKLFDDLPIVQLLLQIMNYYDVEIMLGLTCAMLMLEAMQSLSKLFENKFYFICDFETSWFPQPLCGP
jgi:hypothetical protein